MSNFVAKEVMNLVSEKENQKAREEQDAQEAEAREEELNAGAEKQGLDEHGMDIGNEENDNNEKNKKDNHSKRRKENDKKDDSQAKQNDNQIKQGNHQGKRNDPKGTSNNTKDAERKPSNNPRDMDQNPKSPNAKAGGANGETPKSATRANTNPKSQKPFEPKSPVGNGGNIGGAGPTGIDPLPQKMPTHMQKGKSSTPEAKGAETMNTGGAGATETGMAGAVETGMAGEVTAGGSAISKGVASVGKGKALIANPVGVIVLIVIVIIIIVIGILGFFVTTPQFLWNRLKEIGTDLWTGFKGYVVGMDETLVNKDDVIYVAQYLYDMGYDLVGMGFAEDVKIAGIKDMDGNEVPIDNEHPKDTIKEIDAPFLRAYLVAENRTYLINNYTFNLKDFFNSFLDGSFFNEGHDVWGTGLIQLENSLTNSIGLPWSISSVRIGSVDLGELVDGVQIDRTSNTMRIRRLNTSSGLAIWRWHNDYAYFSLAGWSGRYGKPFELMLTLHIASMSPDLVKEFAMNEDLDAKVHVKLKETTFKGKVYVDGKTIEELEKEGSYDNEGNFEPKYDKSAISALRKLENDNASNIRTAIPYISSVTNHWFRNVYFEGTSSVGASSNTDIGIDEDENGFEDFRTGKGEKTQETRKLSSNNDVYGFGESEDEMSYVGDPILGVDGTITIKGTFSDAAIQKKDAVRGVTNQTTKKLFNDKYYIYDGTIAKAKAIQKARASGDKSIKERIKFTKESLQAFTILETSETLDAQFIYRDLKELVIELGYFEREDFDVIGKEVLEWPIPDYIPEEWPDREIDKQDIEYGTKISCDETVAASMGIPLEDEDDSEEDEKDSTSTKKTSYEKDLKNFIFIGDSWTAGLQSATNIEDATYFCKSGAGAQHWLDNIGSMPSRASKIFIYLGINKTSYIDSMKNLLDALRKKYPDAKIYVGELMHLGKAAQDVDSWNAKIDTWNTEIRAKCGSMSNVEFINVSEGMVKGGYLAIAESDGIHLSPDGYRRWAQNIADAIKKGGGTVGSTKEVADLLKAAKEVTDYVRDNNFEYGSAQYMPPKSDGTTSDDGQKCISCDRMVSWALYKIGFTDLPQCGLCVSIGGDFIEYCEDKGWERIEKVEDVREGDIVFTGQLDNTGMKARHTFICAGENKRFDCGSQDRIRLTGAYSGYTSQPFDEPISGDFMCAYRIAGTSTVKRGFEKDLDVIAMGNGKVVKVLEEGNNLYTLTGLSRKIDGTNANEPQKDNVPGRQQTDQGIVIKLKDKAVKGYQLVIYGFEVDKGISVGQDLEVGDVIGKTLDSDVYMILLDRDKAMIENIEDYIKVPRLNTEDEKNKNLRVEDDFHVADETNFVTDINQFKKMFEGYQNIIANAQAFLDMQDRYKVNAVFAACVTIAESGGGTSWTVIDSSTHNWFSIKGSYQGASQGGWRSYPSFEVAIDDFGDLISNGSNYYQQGKYTVNQIGPIYCDAYWSETVNKLMKEKYMKIL